VTRTEQEQKPAAELDSEEQIVHRARTATSDASWIVGECAFRWCERFARGRTDADFAGLIGMAAESVAQRRRVFETFSDVRNSYPGLRFSHFRAALGWSQDAEVCLAWAVENVATVSEMNAWWRMQHGEDLTAEPDGIPDELETDLPAAQDAEDMETETCAPFRADSGTAADGPQDDGGTVAAPRGLTAEQAVKRATAALERSARILQGVEPDAFGEVPEKTRLRFHHAVQQITDEAGGLRC
jgi:hypothetical protein